MRLCGSDLAAGGICFTPTNLRTGECPKSDAHVIEPLQLVALPELDTTADELTEQAVQREELATCV